MKRKGLSRLEQPKGMKRMRSELSGFTKVAPETAGLDPELLSEHSSRMRMHRDRGVFPGRAECIISGRKVPYCDVHGYADLERKVPMSEKTCFRGYSMTKPITAMGLFVLIEEGKVSLKDPVEKYIPSFGSCKVVRKSCQDLPVNSFKDVKHLEPLKRPVLVRDCLLHTAGLGYGPSRYDFSHKLRCESPIEKSYKDLVMQTDAGRFSSLAEFCDALASVPLRYQPGTAYKYSHGLDVIARVIEVVSGQSLPHFLKTRVLQPLDMVDTTFAVPQKAAETTLSAQYKVARNPGGPKDSRKLVRLDSRTISKSSWVAPRIRYALKMVQVRLWLEDAWSHPSMKARQI